MIVKLLKISGQAAVVTYRENVRGMLNARVISVNELPQGLRFGQECDIPAEVIISGTEYGIDWGILLNMDYGRLVTESLREHAVWTIQDLETQSQSVIPALISVAYKVYNGISQAAKEL